MGQRPDLRRLPPEGTDAPATGYRQLVRAGHRGGKVPGPCGWTHGARTATTATTVTDHDVDHTAAGEIRVRTSRGSSSTGQFWYVIGRSQRWAEPAPIEPWVGKVVAG